MTDPSTPRPDHAPDPISEPSAPQQEPTPDPKTDQRTDPKPDPLRRSRTSGAFVALTLLGLLLVLLVIFIAQNTDKVHVSFLMWDGTTPLAVALLIAAVGGILVTGIAGLLRIWQLRRRVRRA